MYVLKQTTLQMDSTNIPIFNSTLLEKGSNLPSEFTWPQKDLVLNSDHEELQDPLVDLKGVLVKGDEAASARAAELVKVACLNHGLFQVINHGVDKSLLDEALREMNTIFKMPAEKKVSVQRKPGDIYGYSGAHVGRFTTKLPWKETFSFVHPHETDADSSRPTVVDYFKSKLGDDFEHTGVVFQKYCEKMKSLALVIFELLAIGLGVDRLEFKNFYEDGYSLMRCNYYPPCKNSSLILGTGPHTDPVSLTILHQDHVGGLEAFANDKWHAVKPNPDALVITIGDTFEALCNGRYKSCLHMAKVNKESERISLAYFVNPRENRVVRASDEIVAGKARKYPDFTWAQFLEFTQKHHRADDGDTVEKFLLWLQSSNSKQTDSI